jgi:WD40 repeat protein
MDYLWQGHRVIKQSAYGTLQIGDLQHTLVGHSFSVNAVMFFPDGLLVASASNDNTIRPWETATGALQNVLMDYSDSVNGVTFSLDDVIRASLSDDTTVRLWDTQTGAQQSTLKVDSSIV